MQASPRCLGGGWQCADHHIHSLAAGAEAGEQLVRGGLEPATNEVALNRVPHGLAHDKTESHHVGVGIRTDVRDSARSGEASAASYHRPVIRTSRDAIRFGEHREGPLPRRIRPTASRGPYGDEPRGSHDPHAYAYGGGTRGSSRACGCSAGTFSCSYQSPWWSLHRPVLRKRPARGGQESFRAA